MLTKVAWAPLSRDIPGIVQEHLWLIETDYFFSLVNSAIRTFEGLSHNGKQF